MIWILLSLFCLNRLVLWIIFFKRREFGIYGTIVIIINHLTSLGLPIVQQPRLELEIYWRIIGIIVFIIGMYLIKIAHDEFNKMKIRPNAITTRLNTIGIYNKVRHPIYLGQDIYFLGWSLIWGAIYSFYFIPIVILLNWQQAYFEEEYILKKDFGEEYIEYMKKVGMFVPKWRKKI